MDIKDFNIDIDSLDREWLEHSNKYVILTCELADAIQEKSEEAETVKIVQADLILSARESGEELIGVKPTDSTVNAWVAVHPDYKSAKQRLIEAEHVVNILQGKVTAMGHRKNALENLVDLWQGGYFSSPRENKNSAGMKEQSGKEKQTRQRKKMNEEK